MRVRVNLTGEMFGHKWLRKRLSAMRNNIERHMMMNEIISRGVDSYLSDYPDEADIVTSSGGKSTSKNTPPSKRVPNQHKKASDSQKPDTVDDTLIDAANNKVTRIHQGSMTRVATPVSSSEDRAARDHLEDDSGIDTVETVTQDDLERSRQVLSSLCPQ